MRIPVLFLWWALLAALLPTLIPRAAAAAEVRSASARGAQFVLVIDDSGSMKGDDGPAADPDRLSVFAARSLLSMLDPTDEATVVRLNAALEGDAPPPIEPLAHNRARLERLLANDGELARYEGSYTPCRTALAQVQEVLNRAWRQNVAQVVMFLTDGACTPSRSERPEVDGFVTGVRSHREGLLRFYLLRFRGRPFSNELLQLALATGGQAIEVSADDPTALLEPFADALTRSQGYEAELLTPEDPGLAAHRGARRVRLLAVAPGEGEPLAFSIADPRGRPPQRLGPPRTGTHRYAQGDTYRFAALDYRPGEDPVTVRVTGAGERWKVVAVPEYRLSVEMTLHRGECGGGADAATVRHAVESGGTVCATVRLVNEQGRPVARDAAGGTVEAAVRYGRGVDTESLPAEPVGELAEFQFQRSRLETGDHVFQPVVTMRVPGRDEVVTLAGNRTLIQASTLEIRPSRNRFELGMLRAGDDAPPQELSFTGNFPRTRGVLQVVNRGAVPSCITFTLGGRPEGQPLAIAAGQPYPLAAHVAPYCGPQSITRRFEPTLRLAFDGADGGLELPAVEVVTDLHLDWRIAAPQAVELAIRAGDDRRVPIALESNATRPMELVAFLEPTAERVDWPEDGLRLRFAGGGGDESALTLPPGGRAEPVGLALSSGSCCTGGDYRTVIDIGPADAGAYGGALPEPLRIPVRVQVAEAGLWACWGSRILWFLALLALVLAVLYVLSMIRRSSFLDRDLLADKLVPLRWDGYGSPQRWTRDGAEVRTLVRRALPIHRRAGAWIRANPLAFGLPWKEPYRETVELDLAPERGIDRSRVRLVADRHLRRRLASEPEPHAGRLFADAQGGGVDFFGVPRGDRFGRLTPARLAEWGASSEPKQRILRLRRREQLIHSIPDREREEGAAAGWQVG
ncbi:MAG TPA: vWA domain-containing protein [Thermoanaerobaculia bacterium]|nr:vWA domain-containing protein [Thermoanaerobaculia bacterium]